MSRIASDSVALAADGITCVVYDDPAGQTIVQPRSPTAFDPRKRWDHNTRCIWEASISFCQHRRLWSGSGGAFSEPGTTRHAGKVR